MLPEIAEQMIGPDGENAMEGQFAGEIGEFALTHAFGGLWTRPGLDHRARSLVTLGILIALGAEEELAIHLDAARRNGLTVGELEEVVYHATGYVGFPMAGRARAVGRRVLGDDHQGGADLGVSDGCNCKDRGEDVGDGPAVHGP
ncbi:carboxymuconolactone decarboxylase family protein [Pseudonocardia kunmingensis]|nr:carboxymuconolactone decarboxylase family protein [Pseudonocardia kunmingensis]